MSSYKRTDQFKAPNAHPVGLSHAYMAQEDIPHTYKAAMNQSDSDAWLEACQDELLSLWETRTYVPVRMEEVEAVNVVGSWVFTLKRGSDGSVE